MIKYSMYLLLLGAIIIEMVFPLTGKAIHKELGLVVLGAIGLHNFINYRWYTKLFSGAYNKRRLATAIINSGMILSFLLMVIIIFKP